MKRIILLLVISCLTLATFAEKKTQIYFFKVEEDIAQPAVMRVENALEKAKEKGAIAIDGAKMLFYQAEKAWEIWQSK